MLWGGLVGDKAAQTGCRGGWKGKSRLGMKWALSGYGVLVGMG